MNFPHGSPLIGAAVLFTLKNEVNALTGQSIFSVELQGKIAVVLRGEQLEFETTVPVGFQTSLFV